MLTNSFHVRSDFRYSARTHDLSGGRMSRRRLRHRLQHGRSSWKSVTGTKRGCHGLSSTRVINTQPRTQALFCAPSCSLGKEDRRERRKEPGYEVDKFNAYQHRTSRSSFLRQLWKFVTSIFQSANTIIFFLFKYNTLIWNIPIHSCQRLHSDILLIDFLRLC